MKILFVSNNLGRGGKERQIHEIIKVMGSNHQLQIGILLREPLVAYNLDEVEHLKQYIPNQRLKAKEFISFTKAVTAEFEPDIVHTWESGVTVLLHAMRLFYFRRFKVLDGSMRYSKKFSHKSILYWSARIGRMLSHKVIANSQAGMSSLDYARGDKYKVITNGMNMARFSNWKELNPSEDNPFVITMVASFTTPKDYASLIVVALRLLEQGVPLQLNLVGEGPERSKVESMIPQHRKDHFIFHGMIDNPEWVLMKSHVGILLSKKWHSEGYSNTIMESLAAGLPMVCTLTGGNVEMVTDGENGYLILHEDLERLEEVLKLLYADKILRRKMAVNARAFAEKQFSMDRVVSDYLYVYSEMLGE
jgi:glycosyltransferase involved in cell wall biosynthesis